MARLKRINKGGVVYHVLNRANGRLKIFKKPSDFEAFEQILSEAIVRFDMRLCGYCIMSNHWHLVLWPKEDGDLSAFMKWLTVTHSHRWHVAHGTKSCGHLYQGRFKSFPVQSGSYYRTLMQYIESNPLRSKLVGKPYDWQWGSCAIRHGAKKPFKISSGPVRLTKSWFEHVEDYVNIDKKIKSVLSESFKRGSPFGEKQWQEKIATELELESTLKQLERPKKGV